MDTERGIAEHKHAKEKEVVGSPNVTTSLFARHPMGADDSPAGLQSPSVSYRDVSSPQMVYSPAAMQKQLSSPVFPTSPRVAAMFKDNSSPALMKRERSNSIFQRERSNSVFKEKGTAMTKLGLRRRNELEQYLQHRGFCPEELDSIVNQFHDIREKLDDGEWVTREEFKKFFGMREQSFSDQLFDVFKQRHKMHNFSELDFCPSPQVSRERPVGDDGIEMDAINLREFLCGLLLLQSNDVEKKLRMVFDLYNTTGSEITKDNLKSMLLMSAKENKISLTDEQFNTLVDHIFNKMDITGTGKISFDEFKTAFTVTPQHSVISTPLSPSSPKQTLFYNQKIPLELEQRPQMTPVSDFLSMNTSSPSSPVKPFSWTISMNEDLNKSKGDDDGIGTMNPDFVEQIYEEDDPDRTRHKQKNFENQVKANYYPQQEPKAKKAKAHRKFNAKIHSSGTKYLFLGLFFALNLGFFAWQFTKYAFNPAVIDNLGWGVPFARGFAQVLKIDTVLLLIPVSRNVLTYLRSSPLRRWVPLDKNLSFHKFLASAVVVASVGHWGAHMANFYYISTSSLTNLQKLNPVYFKSVPSYIALNFMTIPGITGLMFVMATKRVRKHKFEKFYAAHHFFIIFYAALVLHGASHILGPYEYWKWFVGPAAIYVIERCMRVIKLRRYLKVIEATILPDRAIMLKIELPKRKFNYKAGQYIFINFPSVSTFEWHPFTLTSAPHEDFLSVHIRAAGNWTNKVYNLCEATKGAPDFTVNIDGPYGSASEHVFAYKHAIMIGAGIGVTPFASVLKRMLHRLQNEQGTKKIEKVHFFWTCREQGAFQWFADILSQLESDEEAKKFLEINTFLTGALAQHDIRSILLWYGLQQEYVSSNVDLVTGLSSRTYWGRPNYERIVEYIFQKYPKEKVGVFFCGPRPMAHELRAFCRKHASLNSSTFHFHQEVF